MAIPTPSDALVPLLDRALGSRAIGGNDAVLITDSPAALEAMLALIARARHRVLLENYIVRDDATGRRFAAALRDRAAAGVAVLMRYDALGCRGTGRRFWRQLRDGGVAVEAFGPFAPLRPLDYRTRSHRKLLVVDGASAMVGGLCLGDEWAGDPSSGRMAWRDTSVAINGPAALALERTAAHVMGNGAAWFTAPEDAAADRTPGVVPVWVAEGRPDAARISRAAHLLCDAARERIWITDAYFVAPPVLGPALLDAARAGVDVRLLAPGTSDAPLVRNLTREGYRALLDAGVRVFEWTGPMLHAKTIVVDRRWTRVGSSNLNFQSLYGNFELDVLLDSESLADAMAAQFRRDLASSVEIVRQPRRLGKPRLIAGASVPVGHRRFRLERRTRATIVLRRVAWRLRRKLLAWAAAILLAGAVLLLLFPRVSAAVVAAIAVALGLPLAAEALRQRNVELPEPGQASEG